MPISNYLEKNATLKSESSTAAYLVRIEDYKVKVHILSSLIMSRRGEDLRALRGGAMVGEGSLQRPPHYRPAFCLRRAQLYFLGKCLDFVSVSSWGKSKSITLL